MKRTLTKLICTIFTILLILSVSLVVSAKESHPEAVRITTSTISNPLYKETGKSTPKLYSRRLYSEEESYEEIIDASTANYDALVSAFTEGMENREYQISLYYATRKPLFSSAEVENLDEESFSTLLTNRWFAPLLEDALAETNSPVQGDYLRWVWEQLYCSFLGFYDDESNMYYYKTVYYVTYYTTKAQEDQLTAAVDAVIDGFGFTEQTHIYEKVSVIYDYITSNITYDYENLEDDTYMLKHTAYAAMMNKTAVCQGYALLYYRMAEQCGIDTRVIIGDGGGDHAWNISKLGNYYYNLDATWDAGMDEYSYFLRGSTDFGNHTPNPDYTTSAFKKRYPLSTTYSKAPNPGDRDFSYQISGETAVITGYSGDALEITTPTVLDNYPVKAIGKSAFAGSKVTNVIISDGISIISHDAFSGSAIISITIPESISSIGPSAFSNCSNLTDVYYLGTPSQWKRIPIDVDNDDLKNANLHCKAECKHDFAPATCTTPKTCRLCQQTEGTPLYHRYNVFDYDATGHWHECACGAMDEEIFEHEFSLCYDTQSHWSKCRCGFVKDVASHKLDAGTVTKKATCTATGTKVYKCKDCGATLKTETLSKISHNYTASTCGKTTKCSMCGKTGSKLAHTYTNACDTKCNRCSAKRSITHKYASATCTKAKTCKVCGKTSGSKLGHKYSNDCDTSCNRCGKTRTITHKYKSATCTKAKTCKICGKTSGSKLGHKYSNDCDTKCNRCSKTRTIKHQYKSATCTKAKTCKVCGKTSGSKLGHKYTNACDTGCNRCGKKRSITHDYQTKTTKATTSKNGKVVKKCAECGKISSEKTIYKVTSFKLSTTKYTYSGATRTPTVTVKDYKGKKLTKDTDYTVTYESGRTDVGEYTVTVKLTGKYSGTKKLYFTIVPKAPTISSLTAKSKSLVVKLNPQTEQSSGYQIEYSTSKSFKSSKKITISDINAETATLKSLKAKTTYYVRIRAYKTVDGEKLYSSWSSYQYKKTK